MTVPAPARTPAPPPSRPLGAPAAAGRVPVATGRVGPGLRGRLHRLAPRPLLLVAAAAAVAVALLPVGYLALRLVEAGWSEVADQLFTDRVVRLTARSLALAAVVTAACVVLGVGSAFLVTRTDLPGRRLFGVLASLPLAVPSYVAAYAWVAVVETASPTTVFEGFWASALVLTTCTYPYVFLPVAAALVGVDPAGEEVSRSLGRGPWATFTRVTLRQARPAVAAGGLLVALYVLSDFGAVSILRTDTFTRAIFTQFNLGFNAHLAMVLSAVLVVITVLVLAGETVTRRRGARYTRGGAARPPGRFRLSASRWPAVAGLSVVSAVALGVPALALGQWFVEGVSRPGSVSQVVSAGAASVGVSLLGAVATTLLALPVGLLVARAPGPLAGLLERLSYLPHALPGVVVGLSLVYFGVTVVYPLYQSVWLLVLAYGVLFLPLAVGAVATAAAQAPPQLEQVARSLGRRPWTVFRTVTLPLVAPGVGAGAALAFLTAMKELPATLLLRPTGMDTLATRMWTHTGVGEYAAAAPYAAVLVLVAAVPTWLLASRSGVLRRDGS